MANVAESLKFHRNRFLLNWGSIIDKYDKEFPDADILDLHSLSVVEDRGEIKSDRFHAKPFGTCPLPAQSKHAEHDHESVIEDDNLTCLTTHQALSQYAESVLDIGTISSPEDLERELKVHSMITEAGEPSDGETLSSADSVYGSSDEYDIQVSSDNVEVSDDTDENYYDHQSPGHNIQMPSHPKPAGSVRKSLLFSPGYEDTSSRDEDSDTSDDGNCFLSLSETPPPRSSLSTPADRHQGRGIPFVSPRRQGQTFGNASRYTSIISPGQNDQCMASPRKFSAELHPRLPIDSNRSTKPKANEDNLHEKQCLVKPFSTPRQQKTVKETTGTPVGESHVYEHLDRVDGPTSALAFVSPAEQVRTPSNIILSLMNGLGVGAANSSPGPMQLFQLVPLVAHPTQSPLQTQEAYEHEKKPFAHQQATCSHEYKTSKHQGNVWEHQQTAAANQQKSCAHPQAACAHKRETSHQEEVSTHQHTSAANQQTTLAHQQMKCAQPQTSFEHQQSSTRRKICVQEGKTDKRPSSKGDRGFGDFQAQVPVDRKDQDDKIYRCETKRSTSTRKNQDQESYDENHNLVFQEKVEVKSTVSRMACLEGRTPNKLGSKTGIHQNSPSTQTPGKLLPRTPEAGSFVTPAKSYNEVSKEIFRLSKPLDSLSPDFKFTNLCSGSPSAGQGTCKLNDVFRSEPSKLISSLCSPLSGPVKSNLKSTDFGRTDRAPLRKVVESDFMMFKSPLNAKSPSTCTDKFTRVRSSQSPRLVSINRNPEVTRSSRPRIQDEVKSLNCGVSLKMKDIEKSGSEPVESKFVELPLRGAKDRAKNETDALPNSCEAHFKSTKFANFKSPKIANFKSPKWADVRDVCPKVPEEKTKKKTLDEPDGRLISAPNPNFRRFEVPNGPESRLKKLSSSQESDNVSNPGCRKFDVRSPFRPKFSSTVIGEHLELPKDVFDDVDGLPGNMSGEEKVHQWLNGLSSPQSVMVHTELESISESHAVGPQQGSSDSPTCTQNVGGKSRPKTRKSFAAILEELKAADDHAVQPRHTDVNRIGVVKKPGYQGGENVRKNEKFTDEISDGESPEDNIIPNVMREVSKKVAAKEIRRVSLKTLERQPREGNSIGDRMVESGKGMQKTGFSRQHNEKSKSVEGVSEDCFVENKLSNLQHLERIPKDANENSQVSRVKDDNVHVVSERPTQFGKSRNMKSGSGQIVTEMRKIDLKSVSGPNDRVDGKSSRKSGDLVGHDGLRHKDMNKLPESQCHSQVGVQTSKLSKLKQNVANLKVGTEAAALESELEVSGPAGYTRVTRSEKVLKYNDNEGNILGSRRPRVVPKAVDSDPGRRKAVERDTVRGDCKLEKNSNCEKYGNPESHCRSGTPKRTSIKAKKLTEWEAENNERDFECRGPEDVPQRKILRSATVRNPTPRSFSRNDKPVLGSDRGRNAEKLVGKTRPMMRRSPAPVDSNLVNPATSSRKRKLQYNENDPDVLRTPQKRERVQDLDTSRSFLGSPSAIDLCPGSGKCNKSFCFDCA